MNASEIVEVVEEEEEDKECEDWCFVCKDGGELMLCDFKDCPKVYHSYCVKDDITRRGGEESLICGWHKCYICTSKRPKLYCYCCSHAVCDDCTTHSEFIRVKDDKGLCNQCQEYVVAIEEIQENDAAQDMIDLKNRDTFECLFLEYWEIVKEREEITFDDVCKSKSRVKGVSKLKRYRDDPKEWFGDDDDDEDDEDDDGHPSSKSRKKSVKVKKKKYKDDDDFAVHAVENDAEEDYDKTVSKSKSKMKGMEFIGWGSKPLIDFLTSIGEDTKEAMSQYTVESVIRKYIRQKNLFDREMKKKKKVCCDEKLFSIFRKKTVNLNRIFKLLDNHLKENIEYLEDLRRLEHGFPEMNEDVLTPRKKQNIEKLDLDEKEKPPEMEDIIKPEMQSTGFAMISAENLKHVYLRKSLIVELLKEKESFENKVVGSFVKVKNDPRDSMAFQILQVTGIGPGGDQSESVLLYTAVREVRIAKLDDSDISKEEIEDLKQKVMNKLLRQPTLVEMEQKAKDLHEDITKHWIARQLNVLQKRINYANEKGLRRELDDYLEQRELLEKPEEQERLLRQTPRISEELVEMKQEQSSDSSSKQGNLSGLSPEAVIDID